MMQDWFEMRNVRKRRLADAVWIPLRSAATESIASYGYLGHKKEFFGLGSIAFPVNKEKEAEKLSWSDIGPIHSQGPYAFKTSYKPADVYQYRDEEDFGIELVLEQSFGFAEPHVWLLNQDLIMALGLLREGDSWLRPKENYIEVARLTRNNDGTEASIEIRAEFLRDYLNARKMILKLSTYRQRREVVADATHIDWPGGRLEQSIDDGEFQGHVAAIHEGGGSYGGKAAVVHAWRTDVDPEVDVPSFGQPDDSNTDFKSWTAGRSGRKLFHVEGQFWRDELILPAHSSPRVRGDRLPPTCSFIIDAAGTRCSSDELNDEDVGRWLWFDPNVIPTLSNRRGGALSWYTRETGSVETSPGDKVHFGINEKGLITVYAHDVARLAEWQQRIWMGYNVAPDGKVSAELLTAQMSAQPADTLAPEEFLGPALKNLDEAFRGKWGTSLFRQHHDTQNIIRQATRFRSTDLPSLLALAKDLNRLTADRIDTHALHSIVPLEKGETRGSLKSLERVLATLVPVDTAHQVMGPLVGVYNLRLADAHPASRELSEELLLAEVDPASRPLEQGYQLLYAAVGTLVRITHIIESERSLD